MARKTTTGRGIYSQYNPDSVRDWEQLNRGRARSPDKTLQQLRQLHGRSESPVKRLGLAETPRFSSPYELQRSANSVTLPHTQHTGNYGWQPPSPERTQRGNYQYTYGIANTHNHKIHNVLTTISSRKP